MERTLVILMFMTGSLKSVIRGLTNITGARHGAKWLRDASVLRTLGSSILFGYLGWVMCRFQNEFSRVEVGTMLQNISLPTRESCLGSASNL
jgi:hypothetical protein